MERRTFLGAAAAAASISLPGEDSDDGAGEEMMEAAYGEGEPSPLMASLESMEALGFVDINGKTIEDMEIFVSGYEVWDGHEDAPVASIEFRQASKDGKVSFSATVDAERALELSEELRDAAGGRDA